MNLPRPLVDEIRAGRVVLFLGAGASVGATDAEGGGPPVGNQLRDLLVEKFLEPAFRDRSLAVVAELATSETDLFRVQDFVAEQFKGLEPAEFHKAIPTLKWRAIATTNFDRVVEEAYRAVDDRVQEMVPIYSDEDRVDDELRSDDQVALMKLHGCVTLTHREDLPLILTIDQYATHRENRRYLFQRLEGLAREYPIVFVGHRLEDPDIREMLMRLTTSIETRPRYYLVGPDCTEIEERFWERKKVTALPGTLEDFIAALETEIPQDRRQLLKRVDVDHPVRRRFVENEPVSPGLARMLDHEAEYVHSGMAYETGDPQAFFRGFGQGWFPVREDLDVRRRLTDTLLTDVVIRPEGDRPVEAELYVVKAEAGAGKSVLLRRLAWEAATEADVLTLYVRGYGSPDPDDLAELQRLTNQRIFLIWDSAGDHVSEIVRILDYARQNSLAITVITAERRNEWNVTCERLDPFVVDSFDLHYLSETELRVLVDLLERHDSLGPNLRNRTPDERVEQFKQRAGRQLLVALHEATAGIPFEEILQDEYENIRPLKAKQLYLTICVLNRLRTPVRAGFISRVHDIPFEEFREQLFAPLDHVVEVNERPATGDYYYRARHPEIAQIVFTRILSDRDDRFNEYIRIISNLNLAYNTDRDSFRGLLRAKSLHELFPEYQDVRTLFERAENVGPTEAYLYQQRANYERIRPQGNLREAQDYLRTARELDPRDTTITHTLAEVYRARAEEAETLLARQRIRDEARSILRPLLGYDRSDEYARVTLVKLGIDDLKDILGDDGSTDREIDEAIREVDRLLEAGLQEHPEEQYLLTAEADFSALVADHDRSFDALERAFEANPHDPYIANRLARAYRKRDDLESAQEILGEALKANRGDLRLNFQYAEVLRTSGSADAETLAYHYERAFTPGDRNFEAQFWFARFAFESANASRREKGKNVFRSLRKASISHARRVEVRDTVMQDGHARVYQGTADRIEQSYGHIRRDGPGDLIFVHSENVDDETWQSLKPGERVCFAIGFSFSGAKAVDVEIMT